MSIVCWRGGGMQHPDPPERARYPLITLLSQLATTLSALASRAAGCRVATYVSTVAGIYSGRTGAGLVCDSGGVCRGGYGAQGEFFAAGFQLADARRV